MQTLRRQPAREPSSTSTPAHSPRPSCVLTSSTIASRYLRELVRPLVALVYAVRTTGKHYPALRYTPHSHILRSSYIARTKGFSNDIVPQTAHTTRRSAMSTMMAAQRPGARNKYWHADVFEFLDLHKHYRKEALRAHGLLNALWICDLLYVPSRLES